MLLTFLFCTVFFFPSLNQLESFSEAWNLHSVRTERHWTPRKMWINGMIAADNRGQVAVRDVVEGMQDDAEEFGVQYDPPLAEEQVHTVFLPETLCTLTPDQHHGYHRQFTQLKHFRGCGTIYCWLH